MIDVEAVLATKLKTLGKVYPLSVAEDPVLPCIVYQRIDTVSKKTHSTSGFDTVRFQIDCWDKTYSVVRSLADSVITLLDLNKTDFLFSYKLNRTDTNDPETGLYRATLEFSIWDN